MTTNTCKSIGCFNSVYGAESFCPSCIENIVKAAHNTSIEGQSLSEKYPQYFKDVSHLNEIDVYTVHLLFGVHDPSGCLHHASKKILLSGVRTGGKSVFKDIREARDTLTRWLQLNADNELVL